MDSSSVLRQQSQSKICSDFQRTKNEHNKMPAHLKPSKLQSAPHLPAKDMENQDPGNSQIGRKPPVRPGVSKLPVLAKTLHLQTPSDFSQSHCRWEDKPLAGKARKKKPCTRPIPFNLSQPKGSRMASENEQPLTLSQSRTGTHAVKPDNNICNGRLKSQNIKVKPIWNSHVMSTKGTGMTPISQRSGQSVPSNTFKSSTTLSKPLSSVPYNATHQNSAASPAKPDVSAEACLDNMNLLSLNDPTKMSNASQNAHLTTQKTAQAENFQSDHAAMLSILRNEGVSATGLGSATPTSKPNNYGAYSCLQPQRVSVMKSRQKAGPTTAKSVQFSPDSAALQSILRNEGLKAGGPLGVTPGNPVRASRRGTSIYTAQRVPVRGKHAEASSGAVALALRETPQKTWTPQRVRDTRHQSMSAMKCYLLNKQSPYAGTPGLQNCKTNLQPRQEEEVVQRLFDDEDEQITEKDPGTQAGQAPVQAPSPHSHCGENLETSRSSRHKEENEQRIVGGQPFFQSLQRESVIFFSTGKKLQRAPRFELQESSALNRQHGPVSSYQSSGSEANCRINPSVQSLHRDLIGQKTCALSREERRLDDEVATHTSVSVPAAPGLLPPRPRCGNPLASILHSEELYRFLPISSDFSSGPSSPQSSPLQER